MTLPERSGISTLGSKDLLELKGHISVYVIFPKDSTAKFVENNGITIYIACVFPVLTADKIK